MTATHPAYETLREVTQYASVLLQQNPGPMTLDGTNTWLLRAPGSDDTVVVDPGQSDEHHLETLLAAAPKVSLVLVTHGHFDHSQAAAQLHERTAAPVRAVDRQFCHGAAPLADGEKIDAAGLQLQVLSTPGHTADSVSFVVGDGAAVLTGDTILGRGTTVVAHPDGVLGPYLESLRRLRDLGEALVLTGHGPELASARDVAEMYLAHRDERLEQVRAALAQLGPDATARQIVELVYADVDRSVWFAAEMSVLAQLAYLREQ
ncbi:MAG TPA: MBL fold metallo-hydrolase [Jatrophihabitans sp.]|nr:MBL fold metallo-hydrolase [Jatrophihabitans sp.]